MLAKSKKICVFTAHSPLRGAGSVILKSLIENITDISFCWYYTANNAEPGYETEYLGKPLMGGNLIKDIWQTWKMLTNRRVLDIDNLVNQLSKVECDGYWIVSYNEGLRLAIELSLKQKRPIHMTVHDDWAGAICARSIRYRYLAKAAKKLTVYALKTVGSFDVISTGMQNYYQQLCGIRGEVCHRYLPESSIKKEEVYDKTGQYELIAGHIGSIYDKNDLIAFLSIFHDYAKIKEKKAVLKMWGSHLTINDVPKQLRNSIIFYNTLSEEEVIPELASCAFVYAMYPLNKALEVFYQTSLPTKLTSYLQAGRPIFGHGPLDSSLAEFLKKNDLGVMWTSQNQEEGFNLLEKIISSSVNSIQLENTRRQYFGQENTAIMSQLLLNI